MPHTRLRAVAEIRGRVYAEKLAPDMLQKTRIIRVADTRSPRSNGDAEKERDFGSLAISFWSTEHTQLKKRRTEKSRSFLGD